MIIENTVTDKIIYKIRALRIVETVMLDVLHDGRR